VGLFLEGVVLLDLIRLEFKEPAHGFGLDVKLLAFIDFE
jgi:hypothetical protein